MDYLDAPPLKPSRDGVLVLSGNRIGIRVDNGLLKITSDGEALSYPRATCPLRSIVVIRPTGYVSFAALEWLRDRGVSLTQLDWTGKPVFAACKAGIDQPALRRAQIAAVGNALGTAIMQTLLTAKIRGQERVLSIMGSPKILSRPRGRKKDMLQTEANTAASYWDTWRPLRIRFARATAVPKHWQSFGNRQSPITTSPQKAITPGNALVGYLYSVAASELTVSLAAHGLDPSFAIFHDDRENRASLTYDAIEPIRPIVDLWLFQWLQKMVFAKRDFYEMDDGTVRVTRPLTAYLAMTRPMWRKPAEAIAQWIAACLREETSSLRRIPGFTLHLDTIARMTLPKTCAECGRALSNQKYFCSHNCYKTFNVATYKTPNPQLIASRAGRAPVSPDAARRNLAARHAFDRTLSPDTRAALAAWYAAEVAPKVVLLSVAEICRVTGLAARSAHNIRKGMAPHPRHFTTLAQLVGVRWAAVDGAEGGRDAAEPQGFAVDRRSAVDGTLG